MNNKKMLDGWYCRSIANMQANESARTETNSATQQPRGGRGEYTTESSSEGEQEPNYRAQYQTLKKKLKYLIYENECFQDALRSSQKRLLKVSRDRSFLLDRLLQYEKPDSSTSESEETESSEDTEYSRIDPLKRRRMDSSVSSHNISNSGASTKAHNSVKRKRATTKKTPAHSAHAHLSSGAYSSKASPALGINLSGAGDGHMTPAEVERHLQSRQSYQELLPERAPPTVPTEMFSNDPSLDSESNDVLENSPNVDEWFD